MQMRMLNSVGLLFKCYKLIQNRNKSIKVFKSKKFKFVAINLYYLKVCYTVSFLNLFVTYCNFIKFK